MRLKVSTISAGYAVGPVFRYCQKISVPGTASINMEHVDREILRCRQACESVDARLGALFERLVSERSPNAGIFKAQRDMLRDAVMTAEVHGLIRDGLLSAEAAVTQVYDKYIRIFSNMANELIAQRAADLSDLKSRFLRALSGDEHTDLSELTEPVVLAVEELFPSDTVMLDPKNVLGIITQVGGYTSHAGIIARSMEIPAVVWEDALSHLGDGDLVAVDALDEVVVVNPDAREQAHYVALRERFVGERENIRRYAAIEPVTADGARVQLGVNIGSASEAELKGLAASDGVGLFRTEFLYMGRDTPPDEEAQYRVYRKVLEAAEDKPVTLRTLDIGGDKEAPCLNLPKEKNPFLGVRAIRLCFEQPELLRAQLRAALRAGVHGWLEVMLPMISSVEDVKKCLVFIEQVKEELRAEGVPFAEQVPLGVMVEVPALAFVADSVAGLVDFASIGTNDLCQYLTASDRLNPRLGDYYQPYHPGMFRCIRQITDAFGARGKPVSVCGEMGADPAAAMIFLGLGIRKLSMSAASFAGIKRMLSATTTVSAAEAAKQVLTMETSDDIKNYMNALAKNLNFG